MNIDREELAWAGGLFEGEGYVGAPKETTRNHRYIRAQIGMCDLGPLERFQRAVGVGSITGPYGFAQPNRKPAYFWSARTFEKTQAVMAMLWPWLGTRRREQYRQALNNEG